MAENIFWCSDLHFSHKNILKFCPNTRQGIDVDEHNEILIRNWQKQVGHNDRVYCLGDVFFCDAQKARAIMDRLPGQIHLIYGNHDKVIKSNSDLRNKFASISDYKEIDVDNTKVVMFHFPILEFHRIHRGSVHLYGHCHGSQDNNSVVKSQKMMDVGVDGRPDGRVQDNGPMSLWTWAQIKRIMDKRPVGFHHGKQSHGDM